ncbi:MAG: sigma-70 family RNA polymerase sigma factor [Kineosporiaceae bacterium]
MAEREALTGRPPVLAGVASTRHLLAAQAGDEDAFAVLYRHVQPALLRYLGVLVGGDAEDVAAEAWTQACRDLHRFRGPVEGFRAWVTTIARHRALDHLRAQRRRPANPLAPEDLPEPSPWPDAGEEAVEHLGTRWALHLVTSLPQDQAEAVMLRTVMGLDAVTAARVLGKRPGAVRMATHRGLKALQARMDASRSPIPPVPAPARPVSVRAAAPRAVPPRAVPPRAVPPRTAPARRAQPSTLGHIGDTPVGGIHMAGMPGRS